MIQLWMLDSKEKLERLVDEIGIVCRRKLEVKVAKGKVMPSVRVGIVGETNIVLDGQGQEALVVLGALVTMGIEVEAEVQQRTL